LVIDLVGPRATASIDAGSANSTVNALYQSSCIEAVAGFIWPISFSLGTTRPQLAPGASR